MMGQVSTDSNDTNTVQFELDRTTCAQN